MGAIERVQQWVHDQYSSAISELKSWYDEATHHGCFCGAGTRCQDAVDALDSCCAAHDAGYTAAGISADVMWEVPNGWVLAIRADSDLVACAGGAHTDNTGYQQQLIWLFSRRVEIASVMQTWIERAEEIERGFDRLRDWLLSAAPTGTELTEGVAAHTASLTEMGAAHDEVAALVTEHAPTDGTAIA